MIALHLGAGYHSTSKEQNYKRLCKRACSEVIDDLRSGKPSSEILVKAIKFLENDPNCNAGKGSNLNCLGEVECDAGIMDGKTLCFGGIGGSRELKNPIQGAKAVLEDQSKGIPPSGLVPPALICGSSGICALARKHNLETVENKQLLTESSVDAFTRYQAQMYGAAESSVSNNQLELSVTQSVLMDTIGAVCVDVHGQVSAGVSSGGIPLKQLGRIGHSCCYGCGCWAEMPLDVNSTSNSVGISASGNGEQLIKTLLCKELSAALSNTDDPFESVKTCFENTFLNSPYLSHTGERLAGALCMVMESADMASLTWVHSTESMCIGYQTVLQTQPVAVVSRKQEKSTVGKSETICGVVLHLKDKQK